MYNAAQYIQDALHAAVNQTYSNIEVIAVDDGSTDGTKNMVASVADARIRYCYQTNRGQSAAINFGVTQSQGEYIKLLDADDWINTEHVASQVECLQGTKDMIASCRWGYFVDDFRSPDIREEHANADYDDAIQWLIDCFTKDEGMVGGWRWLIPRSVWETSGGYDEQLTLHNDVHFMSKLACHIQGVRFAKAAVYSYRRGVIASMGADRSRRGFESIYDVYDLAAKYTSEYTQRADIQKIFADRLQLWLYKFYPTYPDLVKKTEARITELGGSQVTMQGGKLLHLLLPLIGWKGVRQAQTISYRYGWKYVLVLKNRRRLAKFK